MRHARFTYSAPLDFSKTLRYIGRFENDRMEAVADGCLRHVLTGRRGRFLIEVSPAGPQQLAVTILNGRPSQSRDDLISHFMVRTFGADDTLKEFYGFSRRVPLLAGLVRRFQGVRIVGLSSLWECLAWSIIGQQVSVQSAFATRSRLARRAGVEVLWKGARYEGFPSPASILSLSSEELRAEGCSRQKADYLRGVAKETIEGGLDEDRLLALTYSEIRERLLSLRGIGPWSAEYAMLRVAGDPDACPLEDIGLRNAVGRLSRLGRQATMSETARITDSWRPFRGYGTFYAWQTLL